MNLRRIDYVATRTSLAVGREDRVVAEGLVRQAREPTIAFAARARSVPATSDAA
jgi:hypothetical protein